MEITMSNLVVEITRQCNMQCAHCLRGDSEEDVLNLEYVENMFKHVNYISTITFSGGEPLLHPEIIEQIVVLAKKHNVAFGNFYIATNGTIRLSEVVSTVFNLYEYCEENEISMIKISNDQFHRDATMHINRAKFVKEWEMLRFVEISKDYKPEMLLYQGYSHGATARTLRKETPYIEVDENLVYTENDFYLNCKGNIILGCDFSYNNQEEEENIWCHSRDFLTTIENLAEIMEEAV